jgi:alpha-L-rhamnosidase
MPEQRVPARQGPWLGVGVADLPTTWCATWVSPTADPAPAGRRPAYRLRGTFEVTEPVRQHHTQGQAYDVTSLLGRGAHVLDVLLADGWYRGQVGVGRAADQWGEKTAFLAQLEIEHQDGSATVVVTDERWRWSPSHITVADLIEGQHEDRRLRDRHTWRPVATSDRGHGIVVSPAPPVRAVQELRPVSVSELRPGVHVVDLGQNINGHVRPISAPRAPSWS